MSFLRKLSHILGFSRGPLVLGVNAHMRQVLEREAKKQEAK